MQILMIWRLTLTLVSRWSHIELITQEPLDTKNDKRKKKKLEGGKGMESAENSSFKGKRQENILMKKRNIGVILLLQIYTIYLLVSHYLLLVKNKQKPLAKSKRPIRLVSD